MAAENPAPDAFTVAVDGMTHAVIEDRWGDWSNANEDFIDQETWEQAKAGDFNGTSDDLATALTWLCNNPLAFLDAYAETKGP